MDKLDIVIIGAVVVAGVWWFRGLQNRPQQPVQPPPAINGVTPPDSASVSAPASAQVEKPAAVARNPHEDHILLKTTTQTIELSTLGASVTAVTLDDVLESTYHPIQSGAEDDRKPEKLRMAEVTDHRVPLHSFVVAPGEGELASL